MSVEEHHVALPKLYGAPAYARPPRQVTDTPRPFDPDELPIEAFMTDEERAYAAAHPRDARALAPVSDGSEGPTLQARPFSVRGLAGRILKGDSERKSA